MSTLIPLHCNRVGVRVVIVCDRNCNGLICPLKSGNFYYLFLFKSSQTDVPIMLIIRRIVANLHDRQKTTVFLLLYLPPFRGVTCSSWPITTPAARVRVPWDSRSHKITASLATRVPAAGLNTLFNNVVIATCTLVFFLFFFYFSIQPN